MADSSPTTLSWDAPSLDAMTRVLARRANRDPIKSDRTEGRGIILDLQAEGFDVVAQAAPARLSKAA